MAINALNGFKIGGKDPIDTRLVFETEAEMKAFDGYLPDAYFAVTKDTGKFWVYKADRVGDKWIELVGGESTPYSGVSPWVSVENHEIDISDDAKSALSAVCENSSKWNAIANVPEDDGLYGISAGTWTKIDTSVSLSAGTGIEIQDNVINSFVDMELTNENILKFNNGKITF